MRPIETKIHEIADVLFRKMTEKPSDFANCGLFSGDMGPVVFCKYYLRAYPDSAKEAVLDSFLDSFLDRVCSGTEIPTYCSGMTGILEGLRFLNGEGLADVDFSDIEDSYRRFLHRFSIDGIRRNNYDYLHGGLGVLKYFSEDTDYANTVLEVLEQTAVKTASTYKWLSQFRPENRLGYNISLSHGMSSIISVLCSLRSDGLDYERRDRIVRNACNYIMTQQIDFSKYGCFFPAHSLENDSGEIHRSRMAWCYGDLGVSTALWQAGRTLKNPEWRNKAVEVFIASAARRDAATSNVCDAGLCHGSASVCMMYHYMYRQTGLPLFERTRDYWLDRTLQWGHMDDGLAGYKIWHWTDRSWSLGYGLLEGISGIGLMLLSLAEPEMESAKWMNFFMLD